MNIGKRHLLGFGVFAVTVGCFGEEPGRPAMPPKAETQPIGTLPQPMREETIGMLRSIQEFGVLPGNSAAENAVALQAAIDWASPRGGALYVEPVDTPYGVDGGVILRRNVSLLGVHGPLGRGTRHPDKKQPVGSVFAITDRDRPFLTVETATQVRGIQFWYPEQTVSDPASIIAYPPTIQASHEKGRNAQGVTLSCLTFFGEYLAMDFDVPSNAPCEQVLFEHCYGYPLSGTFIRIDHCYDIPRILHCHVNPASRRFIEGQYSRAVVDAVISRKSFAYVVNHTDNAQLMDVFTFGTWGGIYLGPATYGQLTNFNLDCVAVGIHKLGDNGFNRNWQIAQGSIIANTGGAVKDIHPIVIEGRGHTAITNVECFSGANNALSTVNSSQDFMLVRGDQKLTVSMFGCRMRNYAAEAPVTIENTEAVVRAFGCIDKHENPYDLGSN
jgi:hypothetical protein